MPRKNQGRGRNKGKKKGRTNNPNFKRIKPIAKSSQPNSNAAPKIHYVTLPDDVLQAFEAHKAKILTEMKMDSLDEDRKQSVVTFNSESNQVNKKLAQINKTGFDKGLVSKLRKKLKKLACELSIRSKETKLSQQMMTEWKSIVATHFTGVKHGQAVPLSLFQTIANCVNKLRGVVCNFDKSRGKGGHSLLTINKQVLTIHKNMKVGHFKDALNKTFNTIVARANADDLKQGLVRQSAMLKSKIAEIKNKYKQEKDSLLAEQEQLAQELEIRLAIIESREQDLKDQCQKCQEEFETAVKNFSQSQKETSEWIISLYDDMQEQYLKQRPFLAYFAKRDQLLQTMMKLNDRVIALNQGKVEKDEQVESVRKDLFEMLVEGVTLYPTYRKLFSEHPKRMSEKQFLFSFFRTVFDRDVMLTFQKNDATIFYYTVWNLKDSCLNLSLNPGAKDKVVCPTRDFLCKHEAKIRTIMKRVMISHKGLNKVTDTEVEYNMGLLAEMFVDSISSILSICEFVGLPATHSNLRGLKLVVQWYKQTLKNVIGNPVNPKHASTFRNDPNQTDIVALLEAIRQVVPNFFSMIFPPEFPRLEAQQAVAEHVQREQSITAQEWQQLPPHMAIEYSVLYDCYYESIFECCPQYMACTFTSVYEANLRRYLNCPLNTRAKKQVPKLKKFVLKNKAQFEEYANRYEHLFS